MESQDIKNVAGVAYVQTLLRQFGDSLSPRPIYEEVKIDGLLGDNTRNALNEIAQRFFSVDTNTSWSVLINFAQGTDSLQVWYKYLYHKAQITNSDLADDFPDPEEDGFWGKDTKACFDAIFKYVRGISGARNRSLKFGTELFGKHIRTRHPLRLKYEVVTSTSQSVKPHYDRLVEKSLGEYGLTLDMILPYYVVVAASPTTSNAPRGLLLARKFSNFNEETNLPQNALMINGYNVDPGFDFITEMGEMTKVLLKTAELGNVGSIVHTQSFKLGPKSREYENLLVDKFSFKQTQGGTVKR